MDKRTVFYALSIFLKNGDVLHLSGLSREEKDRYFALARNPEMSMLLEEDNGIRNLLGSDIASITFKRYNEAYEKTLFQVEKMLLSESSFGLGVYFFTIKMFVVLAVIWVLKEAALGMLEGDLMTNVMDTDMISRMFLQGIRSTDSIFKYAFMIMLSISLIDIVLGLLGKYYINTDGAPPVKVRRCYGFIVTIAFAVVFSLIKSILI